MCFNFHQSQSSRWSPICKNEFTSKKIFLRICNLHFFLIHYKVKLYANPEKTSYVTVEVSKLGESNFNNNFYWEDAMFFTIRERCACSSGYSEYLMREKRFKGIANCDQTNQQEPGFHCINRFMNSESSCDIPWLKVFLCPNFKNLNFDLLFCKFKQGSSILISHVIF